MRMFHQFHVAQIFFRNRSALMKKMGVVGIGHFNTLLVGRGATGTLTCRAI